MNEYVIVIGANLKFFIHSILQIKNAKQIQVDRCWYFLCPCVFLRLCLCSFEKKNIPHNWIERIILSLNSNHTWNPIELYSRWVYWCWIYVDYHFFVNFHIQYIAFERSVSRFHASYLASWPKNLQQISKLTCISAM